MTLWNLQVVHDAFGPQANLYRDVLRVSPQASATEIQSAFLARRRELFHKLERGADCHKQMDAVVLAVRILGDETCRSQYDASLTEEKKQPDEAPARHNVSYYTVDTATTFTSAGNSSSPMPNNKRRTRIVTPEMKQDDNQTLGTTTDDTMTVDQTLDNTLDQTTLDDMTILSGESVGPRNLSFIDRVTDEIVGALEDTTNSLEQVFNVFTLQEEDIQAVVKRIDKAARQMEEAI